MTSRAGWLAALALGAALFAAAGPPAKNAPATDPAVAAYEAAIAPGLGDSTAARLAKFIATYPRHPFARDAQFELGMLAYARGEYGEARARFRRARPTSGGEESRYWEGLSAFAVGDPRGARDAVSPVARARTDVPRRWDSAYLVALSWAQEGRRAEALAAYRTLFDLGSGSSQAAALYQAQRLAADMSRSEDATEWRKRLLAGYPRSPEAASLKADLAIGTPAGPPPSPATVKRGR